MNKSIEALRAAKKKLAEEQDMDASARQQAGEAQRLRQGQAAEGIEELHELRTQLFSRLEDVPRSKTRGDIYQQGAATLTLGKALSLTTSPAPNWDLLAWSPITLQCASATSRPYTWGATLIYGNLRDSAGLHWSELSFFSPWSAPGRDVPFDLEPDDPDFRLAVGSGMHTIALAYGPREISSEQGREAFLDRWTERFATAMLGNLVRPSSLPIQDG